MAIEKEEDGPHSSDPDEWLDSNEGYVNYPSHDSIGYYQPYSPSSRLTFVEPSTVGRGCGAIRRSQQSWLVWRPRWFRDLRGGTAQQPILAPGKDKDG